MASYARTQVSMCAQVSVLAQAKPAIISPPNNGYDTETEALSKKLQNANLGFAPSIDSDNQSLIDQFKIVDRRLKHIEDDLVLQKQNASNQMRQAAVMAAVASQNKVRLSATERLALTAKKPNNTNPEQQQVVGQTQLEQKSNNLTNCIHRPHHANQPNSQSSQVPKTTTMPTLETLLAVQRQLQRHTRQNLNSMPQDLVKKQEHPIVTKTSDTNSTPITAHNDISPSITNNGQQSHQRYKPLPPSPPKSPIIGQIHQKLNPTECITNQNIETYDKDLPPLPDSVSSSTDDSQLNSLESQQSSLETSLVSLPPPPPPISSYLQQYDEVNTSCSNQSNSSTPSTVISSDVSSVRYFPPVPVKMTHQNSPSYLDKGEKFDLPTPFKNQAQNSESLDGYDSGLSHNSKPVNMSNPATNLTSNANYNNNMKSNVSPTDQNVPNGYIQPNVSQINHETTSRDMLRCQEFQWQNSSANLPQVPLKSNGIIPSVPYPSSVSQQNIIPLASQKQKSQLNYKQHVFSPTSSSSETIVSSTFSLRSSSLMPPPPPPPTVSSIKSELNQGFDEPDSGSFRFPTPPPLDLLLDEGNIPEEDDDFQCKIPTPPLEKSMSSATFQDLLCHRSNQQHTHQSQGLQQLPCQIFKPTTFTTIATTNNLQPPPLFRQSPQQQSPQTQPSSLHQNHDTRPLLTVAINNEANLLSTSQHRHNSNHKNNSHHHHHMMMSMPTSSSSPSSSSDGDGQSSNSSSSTSGIHSSIDSPCSSSSKLDDFNYGNLKHNNKTKRNFASSHESAKIFKKITSALNISKPSQVEGRVTSNGYTPTAIEAAPQANVPLKPRPVLKHKKSVSFSDKVELVACADEQTEDHLPNPLLARVLAGKSQ